MAIAREKIEHNWLEVTANVKSATISCGRNPEDITIVAVTKTHSTDVIESALLAGIKIFGENYVQELKKKYDYFKDINRYKPEWHFIGHLQTNKVKYIAPFISMIHSVDSLHLASEISKQAANYNRVIDILLQVNTSGETSKYGCEPEEIYELYKNVSIIDNVRVQGLMTIGTFSEDDKISRNEFSLLKNLRNDINEKLKVNLAQLSMGMTHDYQIAIEEGATFVRVGTALFGSRI